MVSVCAWGSLIRLFPFLMSILYMPQLSQSFLGTQQNRVQCDSQESLLYCVTEIHLFLCCVAGLPFDLIEPPYFQQSDCFYNAGWTEDVREVVNYLHREHPKAPLFAVGTSIGANILVCTAKKKLLPPQAVRICLSNWKIYCFLPRGFHFFFASWVWNVIHKCYKLKQHSSFYS